MEKYKSGALKLQEGADQNTDIKSGDVLYQVSHLRKSYGEVTPVKDISCDIHKGEVITIIGPSGTGKSTFLNLLNHLETADGGEILFRGENTLEKGYDLNGLRRKVREAARKLVVTEIVLKRRLLLPSAFKIK